MPITFIHLHYTAAEERVKVRCLNKAVSSSQAYYRKLQYVTFAFCQVYPNKLKLRRFSLIELYVVGAESQRFVQLQFLLVAVLTQNKLYLPKWSTVNEKPTLCQNLSF